METIKLHKQLKSQENGKDYINNLEKIVNDLIELPYYISIKEIVLYNGTENFEHSKDGAYNINYGTRIIEHPSGVKERKSYIEKCKVINHLIELQCCIKKTYLIENPDLKIQHTILDESKKRGIIDYYLYKILEPQKAIGEFGRIKKIYLSHSSLPSGIITTLNNSGYIEIQLNYDETPKLFKRIKRIQIKKINEINNMTKILIDKGYQN